jgi:hypothetical protein
MWQLLSQMLQLDAHQRSVLFQNQTSLQFSDSFTRTLNTITNALTRALQSVNKRKNIQCCQISYFNAANINFILQFLSVSTTLSTPCTSPFPKRNVLSISSSFPQSVLHISPAWDTKHCTVMNITVALCPEYDNFSVTGMCYSLFLQAYDDKVYSCYLISK